MTLTCPWNLNQWPFMPLGKSGSGPIPKNARELKHMRFNLNSFILLFLWICCFLPQCNCPHAECLMILCNKYYTHCCCVLAKHSQSFVIFFCGNSWCSCRLRLKQVIFSNTEESVYYFRKCTYNK